VWSQTVPSRRAAPHWKGRGVCHASWGTTWVALKTKSQRFFWESANEPYFLQKSPMYPHKKVCLGFHASCRNQKKSPIVLLKRPQKSLDNSPVFLEKVVFIRARSCILEWQASCWNQKKIPIFYENARKRACKRGMYLCKRAHFIRKTSYMFVWRVSPKDKLNKKLCIFAKEHCISAKKPCIFAEGPYISRK